MCSSQIAYPENVRIAAGSIELRGDLSVPDAAAGMVIFAHGSGSSRFSQRNRHVAARLNEANLGTLLFDLLTEDEERIDEQTRALRFDIPMLAERLTATVDWVGQYADLMRLPFGLFGASTGAAAALIAAAERPHAVRAVVSRGGRPDLASEALPDVQCPTLFIVGGLDKPVIDMNREAQDQMNGPVELEIVAGATHLFEEPGTLDEVAMIAERWFHRHLTAAETSSQTTR